MSDRPRVVILSGCLAMVAMAVPSAALAHGGGGGHRRGHGPQGNRIQRVCAEVGAPLGGKPYGKGHGLADLSEAQVKELKAACEKLATAYTAQRKADEAASTHFKEALASARKTLDAACPALTEHHEPGGRRHKELSTACKEALKAYAATTKEARKVYRTALKEAGKTFQAALSGFETSTKSIFEALTKAARSGHAGYYGRAFGTPGFRGGWAGARSRR